jgi:hypothetical protein
MNALIFAAALAIAGEGPGPAPDVQKPPSVLDPVETETYQILCRGDVCLLQREVYESGERLKQQLLERVEALTKELRSARDMKGCGKVEVLPKLKKDRDL